MVTQQLSQVTSPHRCPLVVGVRELSSCCRGTGKPTMKEVREIGAGPVYPTAPLMGDGLFQILTLPLLASPTCLPPHPHPQQWRIYLGGNSLLSWLLRSSLLRTWVMSTVLAASRALASSSSCLRMTGLGLERR